jgi:hypothetical protein
MHTFSLNKNVAMKGMLNLLSIFGLNSWKKIRATARCHNIITNNLKNT